MGLTGSCHCGAVALIVVEGAVEWVASCNCSICRRLGTLMAYFPDDGSVSVRGPTAAYIQGDRMIALHHCPTCACTTHWVSTGESHGRVGVNARLFDGFEMRDGPHGPEPWLDGKPIEVRFFNNADA